MLWWILLDVQASMEGVANASTWLQGEADLLGHCFESFECICFGISSYLHPWPRPGIGFGNVLCQVDKICPPLPLAERHAGMSKAERRVLGRQAWQFVPFNREWGNIESLCCTTTFTPSQNNAECFGFRLPSCLVMSSYASWPFCLKVAQAVKAAVEAEKALYDSAYRTGKHIGFSDLDDTRPNDQWHIKLVIIRC